MMLNEYRRSHFPFHVSRTRWVAGLTGSSLAALGLAALVFEAAMPLLAGLAVGMALWLAWITFDYALAPLHVRHGDDAAPTAGASPPAFVDTQASWWTP